MTSEQFAAVAKLLRMRGGKAQEAARLRLVHQYPLGVAAFLAGVSTNSARNAVNRMLKGIQLVNEASQEAQSQPEVAITPPVDCNSA